MPRLCLPRTLSRHSQLEIDYRDVVRAWKDGGFGGPVILEIVREGCAVWAAFEDNLCRCAEARDILCALAEAE